MERDIAALLRKPPRNGALAVLAWAHARPHEVLMTETQLAYLKAHVARFEAVYQARDRANIVPTR